MEVMTSQNVGVMQKGKSWRLAILTGEQICCADREINR
jgi:hypothetical protein